MLIRLETSGLCHTDIHAAHGDWPVKPTLPFVPGHEGVGIIEMIGEAVTGRHLGERVAIPWLGYACGECRFCIDGRETLCEKQHNSGYSVDGAFAEYAVASAKYVVPVPDGVTSMDAAPLTCAGVTTYKAIKVAGIVPTEKVAVFGIGGLGHLAVQYGRIVGGSVIAVDIEDAKLDLATELGADHVINHYQQKISEEVKKLTSNEGVDIVVEHVGAATWEQSMKCLKPAGRLVTCGATTGPNASFDLRFLYSRQLSLLGSYMGTMGELYEVLGHVFVGRLKPVVDRTFALKDIRDAHEYMEKSQMFGKVVLNP